MRVSVPTIPHIQPGASPVPVIPISEAIQRVADFLRPGNVTLLTGAGVSVDSGIRAYRGADGRYMNPNYQPIFYHELVDETQKGFAFRQRYWLRSYLGYPPVRDAQPNTTHYGLAALQHTGHIPRIITQNVDGLHHKALFTSDPSMSPVSIQQSILELHGTLHRVRCNHNHLTDRSTFQVWLSNANPKWAAFADDIERSGTRPRTNPDGDVAVESLGISYDDFIVPDCPTCFKEGKRNNVHKPEVIFFGESISSEVKDRSLKDIDAADRFFVMGTTLATYSAYRLLKHAIEQKKPTMMVNLGPSRADGLPGVEKLEVASGEIMRDVVNSIVGTKRIRDDPTLQLMLRSGIVRPPADDEDLEPRAAG